MAKREKDKKKKICLCSQGSFAMFSLHHYKIHFIPLEIVEKRNTVALVCKWRRLRRKASIDIFSRGNQKEYTNIFLRKNHPILLHHRNPVTRIINTIPRHRHSPQGSGPQRRFHHIGKVASRTRRGLRCTAFLSTRACTRKCSCSHHPCIRHSHTHWPSLR